MNGNNINEAVESLTLIKEVIARTNKSFVGFSKLFIGWGILFTFSGIINLLIIMNTQMVSKLLENQFVLGTMLLIIVNTFNIIGLFLIALLIYKSASKKKPLIGLEKHLAKVWLLLIFLGTLYPKISITNKGGIVSGVGASQEVIINNISILLFSMAIALIITSMFTDFKQFSYLGYIFISLSLLNHFFNLAIFQGSMMYIWHVIPVPISLLYTGFFLKSQQARG